MGPIATGTGASETDVLVVARNTPTLNKLYPNGGANPILRSSLLLTGVTPISSLPGYTGGWYEALLGSTSGTLVVADNVAIFVNATTMSEVARTTFAQPAYLLVPDVTHGTFVVQVPDTTTATSGFASLAPATGKQTDLTSKSQLFGGLAVSADGTTLYICSGSQCETQLNQ
jgi:hypothetical protein